MAKTLWLNYMLIAMYVVPFFLWREKTLAPATRSLFGWLFASFALRAPIELWIIFFTRGWRCGYGITHDLLTIGLIAFLRLGMSPDVARRDFDALRIATLLQITLFVEMFMAWEFSRLASPAAGIYFASDTPHFHFVNVASWVAVAIGYPAMLYLLSRRHQELGHVQ
jgi:inner membrane protein involved in colicin E2 resistance